MEASKVTLRKQMKKDLNLINENNYLIQCRAIHRNLFEQVEWNAANTIAVTISRGREINSIVIIEEAWNQKKTVVVPKCIPETKGLQFRTLTSFDQIEEVFFGLKEPIISATSLVESADIDLILVPGLIFDEQGYRIGFGGGYYDRYLATFKGETISLALNEQMKKKLPHEPFDIPVKKIITPKQVIHLDDK